MSSSPTPLVSSTAQWQSLEEHAASPSIAAAHLRSMMQDAERCASMQAEFDGILLDYSRQRITGDTMNMLFGQDTHEQTTAAAERRQRRCPI